MPGRLILKDKAVMLVRQILKDKAVILGRLILKDKAVILGRLLLSDIGHIIMVGETRDVKVIKSALLACHQCMFESRLGLQSFGFSVCHFLKHVARGFLRILRYPPLLRRLNGSVKKKKKKKKG